MVESNAQRSAAGLFRMPGLFVRLSATKGNAAADPDTVWSPTSPLDFKSFRSSPPRVGLGLADALTAAADGSSCCSVHHLVGCRSSFLDSIRPFLELALPKTACGKAAASPPGVIAAAATADEVSACAADSEEYTCVISRGANPRTTHILPGETLEVRGGACGKAIFSIEPSIGDLETSTSSTAGAAAPGRCRCCIKRLPEKMDIFMYM
jgi:hypothetical protein